MTQPEPKKTLVLHVTVPGFWADDLDDCAREIAVGEEPTAGDRLDVVLEEWMRPEVGISLVSLPGEKSDSGDFDLHVYKGQIVGAELRDR